MTARSTRPDARATPDEGGARLVVPGAPAILPRLAVSAAAMLFAILAPLPFVPLIAIATGVVLWRRPEGAPLVAAGSLGVMTVAATLVVTPVWLIWLAGVEWQDALAVAAAFAVRLACLAFIGVALAAALPPRAWLAGLRRFPRLALALTVTFRQVPEVASDVMRLRDVQRARGLLVGTRRWRPLVLIVPLIARGLERADRVSRALVLAGWGGGRARPLVRTRYGKVDGLCMAGAALLLLLTFLPLLNLG